MYKTSYITIALFIISFSLNAQLSIGWDVGALVSKATHTKDYLCCNVGRYDTRAIIKEYANFHIKYQFGDFALKTKLGRRTMGYHSRIMAGFTSADGAAPKYPYPGEHPVHYFNFIWYDYTTLGLKGEYELIENLYASIGVLYMRANDSEWEKYRRIIRVPNLERKGSIPYYKGDFRHNNLKQNTWLLEAGINYFIWKNIGLELDYMVGISPYNLYSSVDSIPNRYHHGVGLSLIFDFKLGKKK